MKNRKQTSPRVAKLAAKTLGDSRASKRTKSLAATALAQAAAEQQRRKRRAVAPKRPAA